MVQKELLWWRGDYWFLDNSFETPILYQGVSYPSVTHAFLGAQAFTQDMRITIALTSLPGLEKIAEMISDPNPAGPDVMKLLLKHKFGLATQFTPEGMSKHQIALAQKLILTSGRTIVYGNNACSTFWGVCKCPKHAGTPGKNVLGGLLMGVRSELVSSVTNGVAISQLCVCENIADAFFMYPHMGRLWLRPFCQNCQAVCGKYITNIMKGTGNIYRFERDWFPKKKKPHYPQTIVIPDYFKEIPANSYRSRDDWDTRRQELPKPESPKLPQNITFYFSGRITDD